MRYFVTVLSCFFFLAVTVSPVKSSCGCHITYKEVGCFKDKRNERALPKMLINERDRYSPYYNGTDIDWHNWNQYLPAFTCRCAEKAMKKGYRYFGLQFWGECWSGPSPAADKEYNRHGPGEACYGLGYDKCSLNSINCVGDNNHNYIYEIVPFQCPVKFERLGCYRDKRANNNNANRPLNEYLLTDRQHGISASSGRSIDWYHFDTYLPEFACRCAQKTVEKGYNTFGVQYYGECWSAEKGDVRYFQDGGSSSCVNKCYEKCGSYDQFCTGEGFTNFVYRVTTDVCEIPYEALGCYNEQTSERALNVLILDDVNPQSSKFTGLVSTSFSDWEEYLKGLRCRCARKIKEKGYTTFGINNGGECWSGLYGDSLCNMHGSSKECYHNTTTPCTTSFCVGGVNTNYVYQLQEENNNV